MEYDIGSFSAVRYVGVKTTKPPTDFRPLAQQLRYAVQDCSVRSHRSPEIVLNMLQVFALQKYRSC